MFFQGVANYGRTRKRGRGLVCGRGLTLGIPKEEGGESGGENQGAAYRNARKCLGWGCWEGKNAKLMAPLLAGIENMESGPLARLSKAGRALALHVASRDLAPDIRYFILSLPAVCRVHSVLF